MKKRNKLLYTLSFLLPFAAIAILSLKSFNHYTRPVALTVYLLSWVVFFLSVRHHRRSRVVVKRKGRQFKTWLKDNARNIAYLLGLILFAYMAFVVAPVDNLGFARAGRPELHFLITEHSAQTETLSDGQKRVLEQLKARGDLFKRPVETFTRDERKYLQELWSMYINYTAELERIMHTHKYWPQLIRHPDLQRQSFFLAYSTFVQNYLLALELTQLVGENSAVEVLLNESNEELSIPPMGYFHVKHAITDPDNLLRLNIGRSLVAAYRKGLEKDGHSARVDLVGQQYSDILKMAGVSSELMVENSAEKIEGVSFEVWLPLQKSVAEGMSYVRFTSRGNLVDHDSIQELAADLEPGDILIERRNWYLTNVGIPGFWPHAALYTGTPSDLDAYFSDIEVPGGGTVSDYLKSEYPEVFKAYMTADAYGHRPRVIESIRPGVSLTTLEHSAHADYLGVLRPRLSKQDKLGALLKAMSYHGRPYDYDFNFVTDNELVCSELVFKSYKADGDRAGIDFELITMSGRQMIPPNLMVRKFDEEYETEDAQLDFVLFMDGNEAMGKAIRKDVEAFRKSWRRPKWSAMQE